MKDGIAMTTLNMEVPKDRQLHILISIMQTIREMDIRSTSTTELKQTAKTSAENEHLPSKDHLDFQIAMIQSLAG